MKYTTLKLFGSYLLILFFLFAYLLLQEISVVQFFIAMMAGMALMAHTMMHYPNRKGYDFPEKLRKEIGFRIYKK